MAGSVEDEGQKLKTPNWRKPFGTIVVLLIMAIHIARIVTIPFRSAESREEYDQSRQHLNTKNMTQISGSSLGAVASK